MRAPGSVFEREEAVADAIVGFEPVALAETDEAAGRRAPPCRDQGLEAHPGIAARCDEWGVRLNLAEQKQKRQAVRRRSAFH
jgi:hypothetical protein